MEIQHNQPIAIIRNQIIQEMKLKTNLKITDEEWMAMAKKLSPWAECPQNNGQQVDMMACMFCNFGHITECHYPNSCREANCSHCQNERELFAV